MAGKLLSILAMMAVAINAQCAMACSLQVAQPQKQTNHSCCKSHNGQASHKPKPCPQTVFTVADTHKTQAPPYFLVESHVTGFNPAVHAYVARTGITWYAIPDIPAFSVLRI